MFSRLTVTAIVLAACVLNAGPSYAQSTIDEIVADAGLTEGSFAMRDRSAWQKPQKIIVRDGYGLVERLSAAFPDLDIVGVDSASAAAREVRDADAVIGFCDDEIVSRAKKLQWIQIFSSGAEGCLSVDAVADDKIVLSNMQKMSSPVIGEHAVAMMMSLSRGLPQFVRAMPEGNWDQSIAGLANMTTLNGKTVLIVGLGGIGTAAAWRANGLGMKVIATRNSSRSGPDFVDYVGLSDELLTLAARSDVVINAVPLTPQTTNLFDRKFFDTVKRGAIFINVARGASVVTDELVAALEDGRIAAAGLDVTEPEPLPSGHQLWQMDNVIITPHIAWQGNERDHYPIVFEENLRRFIAGEALLNVVDPEKGY